MPTLTLDDKKRDYYQAQLKYTEEQVATKSLADLENEFFTNPPSGGPNPALDAAYVNAAGDTMTGSLNINGTLVAPTIDNFQGLLRSDQSIIRVTWGRIGVGLNGNGQVAKAAAIASPTADVAALKTAVDALRVALTNIGITA